MKNALTPLKHRSFYWRKQTDRAVRLLSIFALAVSVGGMIWILSTVIDRGISALSIDFLTESSKPYGTPESGIANALLGTIYMTFGAVVLSLPPGLAGGIYLAEFGKQSKLSTAIRFIANVMMGMPSILIGLFIYAIWVVPTGHFSGLAGSMSLAIIMIPVIIRTTEDMLGMIPDSLRESALALGMTRARATLAIVCRSARNGLLTGILLAVARVSGETAPLLFTALWSDSWPTGFFNHPTANIPVLITEYATNSPFEEVHAAGWGAALVMTALILLLNIGCRILFKEKKT